MDLAIYNAGNNTPGRVLEMEADCLFTSGNRSKPTSTSAAASGLIVICTLVLKLIAEKFAGLTQQMR